VNNDQQLPTGLTKAEFKDDPDQAGDAALLANRGKDLENPGVLPTRQPGVSTNAVH
jgi:hypothetical protein